MHTSFTLLKNSYCLKISRNICKGLVYLNSLTLHVCEIVIIFWICICLYVLLYFSIGFVLFMTYSTLRCHSDWLMAPWNVYLMYVYWPICMLYLWICWMSFDDICCGVCSKNCLGNLLLVYTGSIKCHGQVVNSPALNLEGPGFKSRSKDQLMWLKFFAVFISPTRQILE
jgi:hypothetical protein